jgi:hypothetical protein
MDRILSMTDDELSRAMVDAPVADVAVEHGAVLRVAVPGEAWADEYVAFYVRDPDAVVRWTDSEPTDSSMDYLSVCVPLGRIGEVRDALDRAVAVLEARRAEFGDGRRAG